MLNIDLLMMKKALALAQNARRISSPNPWVGCVIVKNNHIVGEGFTQKPGEDHAEIVALKQAQEQAKGATVYVTLEPCAHYGRTPPCINALIQAKISKVVIGMQDPDPNVQGKGIHALKNAGIVVTEGILFNEIKISLAPYLYHRTTGFPYCLLKGATSIDGKIAAQDGTSQWISSKEARIDAHHLRADSQAIIIGSQTAIIDEPSLTVRDVLPLPSNPPLRVILDSQGRVKPQGPLFNIELAPTLVITSVDCSNSVRESWKRCGAFVETVSKGKKGIGVDLDQTLLLLGKRGVVQALVEGGGKLHAAFLQTQHIQQLTIYFGGLIIGNNGRPLFSFDEVSTLLEAPKFNLTDIKKLGNSVRLDYKIEPK